MDERLAEHLKTELMALIPDFGVKRDINKCVVACKKLSHGDAVQAAGAVLGRELQGVVNLLQDCVEGHSPSAIDVSRMSSFSILFLKKCENFCTCDAYVPGEAGSMTMKRVELQGNEAIGTRFDRCFKAEAGAKDPQDIKEFRMFKWMLSSEQQEKGDVWHKEVIFHAKARLEDQRQAALQDITSGQGGEQAKQKRPIQAAELSTSASSSSSGSATTSAPPPLPPPPRGPLKKQKTMEKAVDQASQKAAEKASAEAGTGVPKFFGMKAK